MEAEDLDIGAALANKSWTRPDWAEPLLVVIVLFGSMIVTRRRGYRISERKTAGQGLLEEDLDSAKSSDDRLSRQRMLTRHDDARDDDSTNSLKYIPKSRRCCGLTLYTPNTSRFKEHYHSRILQKFPFLMEIFYCFLAWAFYRFAAASAQSALTETGIWDVAESHGLAILDMEEISWLGFLFPYRELKVQRYFLRGHPTIMAMMDLNYALVNIPATAVCIAWYYYVAPSFNTFATMRRTLFLTNLIAFWVFVIYPTMPPRFLPIQYGFIDTVEHDSAQILWMHGKYVNKLAAMPSIHFAYSFVLGCTLFHHSGLLPRNLEPGQIRKPLVWRIFYALVALFYPIWILTVTVATANHYFLDALVAVFVCVMAFLCNRVILVLLPIEDLLLWCLRLEKPLPKTAEKVHFGVG